MKIKNKLGMCALFCGLTVVTYASVGNETQVGRYMFEKNGATVSQTDPLQSTFQVTFPDVIQTVGQAMSYLLNNTSYKLAPKRYQTTEAADLFSQTLPVSDRSLGTMTVQDGLQALAGSSYQMLIDPEHRYISFQLKKQYQQLYTKSIK